MTEQILIFHNDEVQKIKYLTLYKNARESGHLMRGEYFDPTTHKGCLIGTAIHEEETRVNFPSNPKNKILENQA